MKSKNIYKVILPVIFFVPFFFNTECKKQPRCGCGTDIIFVLNDEPVNLQYNENANSIVFSSVYNPYGTYYFCNPSKWMDSIKKLNTKEYLLISGDVYYECNYLYQSGNYYYQLPPVYQVIVKSVREDNYGKK
ncbi:MAG: hypothetical protein ACUVTX_03710 [Bacteroidales bacterium]